MRFTLALVLVLALAEGRLLRGGQRYSGPGTNGRIRQNRIKTLTNSIIKESMELAVLEAEIDDENKQKGNNDYEEDANKEDSP
jgi:hypothetical protein